jgi:RecA/RadA recombinase
MSDMLNSLIKVTGNPFAATAEEGIPGSKVTSWIDTGSYSLNALLSGSLYKGVPRGKIMALAGPTSVGKTWFAMSLIKSFLDESPDAVCMYFDSESAVTRDMFKTRGIDTNRVAHLAIDTIENLRNQLLKIVDAYLELSENKKKPIIICVDSLGNLSTNKETTDVREGKDIQDMTRTKLIKGAFRILTNKFGVANITMIVCNHTYQTQEIYSQTVMSGGTALHYCASTIVHLSKRKEKDGKDVVGNVIHCKLNKGRMTKENSMVDVLLRYDTGLNKYYGLLPIAEKYGIFKKVGNKYELPNGKKYFESQINASPEDFYTDDVMKLLETAVDTEFSYGKAFDGVVPDNGVIEEGEDEE